MHTPLSLLLSLLLGTCLLAQPRPQSEDLRQLGRLGTRLLEVRRDSLALAAVQDSLVALRDAIGSPRAAAAYHFYQGQLLGEQNDWPAATVALNRALTGFRGLGDSSEVADVLDKMGYQAYARRDFPAVFRLAESQLTAARAVRDSSQIARALGNLGLARKSSGRWREATPYYRKALRIALAGGDTTNAAIISNNLSNVYNSAQAAQPDSALYYGRRAIELGRATESVTPTQLAKFEYSLASKLARNGQLEEAYQQAYRAAEMARGIGFRPVDRYTFIFYLGSLSSRTGRTGQARELLYEASDLAAAEPDINPTWLYYALGEFYRQEGQIDSTATYFKRYAGEIGKRQRAERNRAVDELETRFQTREKQAEIDRLALADELNQARLTQQRWLIYGGLTVLGVLGAFLFSFWQQQRRIIRQNRIIATSLREKETLLKEIHHRVKNNLQMVSSLLSLQGEFIEDSAALDALEMGRQRVRSMAIIHQRLYLRDEVSTRISTPAYLEQLVGELMAALNVQGKTLRLHQHFDPVELDIDRLIPLGLVANEVITNAMKHAFQGRTTGELNVSLLRHAGEIELRIADDGPGHTTRLTGHPDSFGNLLIRTFAEQLNGRLAISQEAGTRVSLWFPIES